ncbi:MAG: phospholipid carrier-dependent glycosyltransferase [Chloroflexi bacterium]|nr:phospholipid carrier-dependent glycosyltransferase [Chloroflexota bacterium]
MNISQLPLFLKKPFAGTLALSRQFLQTRSLPAAMGLLQLLWLAVIVGTGTSTRYGLILALAIFSVAATLAVIYLPDRIILKFKEPVDRLFVSEKRTLLSLALAAILIGVVYAGIQHLWGDEKESFRVATILSSNPLVTAYMESGWMMNHPPLIPLIYGFVVRLFGANLLYLRLVSVLFLAGVLAVTYLLGRELYGRDMGYLAPILFLSFPLVIRLGASAMLDVQLAFFFCLAMWMLVRPAKQPSVWLACAAGAAVGLGLLTKYIMIFIFVVLFFFVLLLPSFRKIKFHLLAATLVSASIFAGWLSYANSIGLLPRQIEKILNFSGIYHVVGNLVEENQAPPSPSAQPESQGESLDQGQGDRMQSGILRLGLESLLTRIPSSLGVHYAPLIILGMLYLIKDKNPANPIVLLWIGAVSASLFLTLPDHRYFLPVFPAIAIVVARVLRRFPVYAERTIILGLLFEAGNLYLFANWIREAHFFPFGP